MKVREVRKENEIDNDARMGKDLRHGAPGREDSHRTLKWSLTSTLLSGESRQTNERSKDRPNLAQSRIAEAGAQPDAPHL